MQGPPDKEEEETYAESADTFAVGARDEQSDATMARLIMVDLPGVSMQQRELEQTAWLQSGKGVSAHVTSPAPYQHTRMIGVTLQYAVCFELLSHEDYACPAAEAEQAAAQDASYYEQRLSRIATQLQATLLIQECNTRMTRTGTPLQHVIDRASVLREKLPLATDMLELAEHPAAVAAANAAINKAPTSGKPKNTRPQSMVVRLHDPSTYTEKKKKKKRKRKKKTSPAAAAQLQEKEEDVVSPPAAAQLAVKQEDVVVVSSSSSPPASAAAQQRLAVKRRIRVCRIDSATSWPTDVRRCIPCVDNAKVHVNDTRLLVVDRVSSIRIRVFNLFDIQKPVFEHFLSDPEHLLGSPVDVAVSERSFCVAFAQHILCGRWAEDDVSAFVIKLDKPVVTCVCFHENHIVIGATHGSIYYYSANTGEPQGLTDTPWDLPVLGCRAQGPNLLAWDQRNVFRYHALPDTVAPYHFCASRPLGAAGCGSLLFAASETGSLWITDTIAQEGTAMRQVIPPKTITKRYTLDKKNQVTQIPHDATGVEQEFYRLCTPVTYAYNAVCCDRRTATVLYPDGTCSRLTLEI
jgi:hypothetical protein